MEFARAKMLEEYAKAAVNLYGVIPLDEWAALFRGHHRESITEEDWAFLHSRNGQDYYLRDGHLIQFSFKYENFENVRPLLRQVLGKPRYVPELEALLKHATLGYFAWTPQIKALDQYVRGEIGMEDAGAKGTVDQVALMCMSGAGTKDILDILSRFIEVNHLMSLAPLIMEVHNHSRMWANKGHTPAEMMAGYMV